MYRLLTAGVLLAAVAAGCQRPDPVRSAPVESPEASELPALKPGVHRETLTTPDGDTLRCTFSIPKDYDGKKPVPLAVALHYGGEMKPFLGGEMLEALVAPGLAGLRDVMIVAPDSLGGSWTTPQNERAVLWLTRSVMRSYAIDPKRVLLTGFSLGAQGAWYLGGRHQDLYTAVVPIAGEPAGGGLEWQVPVYVIHSSMDEVIPLAPVKRQVARMKEKGAKVYLMTASNLTHYQARKYDTPLRHAVAWLKEQGW
jgi:predicted peptidase